MNTIAVCLGGLEIYWNAVIISLGVIACFCLCCALRVSDGHSVAPLLALLPIAVLLSVLLSRVIHWYCHIEQYSGLLHALTDYSVGSFCIPGVLLGVFLSAVIVKRVGLVERTAGLLDELAPGISLCLAMIRLSALFDGSCRSKIIVSDPNLHYLPFAAELYSSSGAVEYRFASFFIHFLLLLLLTAVLISLFMKRRSTTLKDGRSVDGDVAAMFLLLYSATELVIDSTRCDSSFFHFTFLKALNPYAGFISFIQLIAAVCVLGLMIYYSRRSVRANTVKRYHLLLWGAYAVSLGGVGVSEYLVQRHGNWYLGCYAAMTLCAALMAFTVIRMYLSLRVKATTDTAEAPNPS